MILGKQTGLLCADGWALTGDAGPQEAQQAPLPALYQLRQSVGVQYAGCHSRLLEPAQGAVLCQDFAHPCRGAKRLLYRLPEVCLTFRMSESTAGS